MDSHSQADQARTKLDAHLARQQQTPDRIASAAAPLNLLPISELMKKKPMTSAISGMLPRRGIVVIYGAPGSGKTFVMFDIAGAIARGIPWSGRRVKRGNVAYVATEGAMRDRADAYMKRNDLGSGDLDCLRILDSSLDLLDEHGDHAALTVALRSMEKECGPIAMIVVDTLSRATPGADENSSTDMGRLIQAVGQIEREFQCVVVLVHHTGKDAERGARGHSSLKAAADVELSVKRDGDVRCVTIEKSRDGIDGECAMSFELESVDLGSWLEFDPDADPGERRTSCVVRAVQSRAAQPQPSRLTATERIALDVLQELCKASEDRTEDTSLHPAGLARIQIDDWRDAFRKKRGITSSDPKEMDSSRKAFQRAMDKLASQKVVGVHESKVWKW